MAIGKTNVRPFDRLGVIASVTVIRDKNFLSEIEPTVDQKTGKITLPEFMAGKLPSHFVLSVAHHKDNDRVIVAQREKGDRYQLSTSVTPFGELLSYSEPPCEVRSRNASDKEMSEQDLPRQIIWTDTQMQNQRGSNRADIICVSQSGEVTLSRLLVLYVDGKPCLVEDTAWLGDVYKRTSNKPYELKHEDGRIASAYRSDEVRKLLNEFVFVPHHGYPSIEGWLQMLLLPKFRQMVRTAHVAEWDGSEDFWNKPEPKVALGEGQAMVEWFVYGTGGTAMGYAKLAKPIIFKGRTIESVQLRHHSVDTDDVDVQGLKKLLPGDILKIHKLVDMDHGSNKFNPLAMASLLYAYRDRGTNPDANDKAA